MKLTTKGRYAVMAMVDIAFYSDEKPMSMPEISDRQNIPLTYLEQLFVKLRKASLIESVRGPKGGYKLSKEPNEIAVSDVIMAVDEPMQITRCNGKDGCIQKSVKCMTHHLWEGLGQKIHSYLSSMSLADICNQNQPENTNHVSASYKSFVEVEDDIL